MNLYEQTLANMTDEELVKQCALRIEQRWADRRGCDLAWYAACDRANGDEIWARALALARGLPDPGKSVKEQST